MLKFKRLGFLIIGFLLFYNSVFGAWDASKPTDNQKLKDTPALIRANWDAIALGTDSDLQITNAKVSASAAIVDTKLAQITTALKVSGTALTGFANIPSGAGVIPIANLPYGTAANQLVKLDANARIPALDGSLLSNVIATNLIISSQAQGDLVFFNGTIWTRLGAGTAGYILTTQGVGANPVWTNPAANVQIFTSSGTWTATSNMKIVEVYLLGGGGGGGSGRRGANDTARGGGSGGNNGDYVVRSFNASDLTWTVAVTIGAGNAGGVAVTADSTNGNAGTTGGNSSFGTYVTALGGNGGSGGTAFYSGTGQDGSDGTYDGGGGGGAGDISTSNVATDGGSGGIGGRYKDGAGFAGGSAGTSGGAGGNGTASTTNLVWGGGGGGGGGASTTTNAGIGGNGATYGAGGGGGGASKNATGNSGAGGNGAAGIVYVMSY